MLNKYPNISIELKEDFILVTILANLDSTIAEETRNAFTYLIEHADRNIRFDLSASDNIDASGIGSIAFLFKRLNQLNFHLELTGVQDTTLALIQALYVDKIIPAFPYQEHTNLTKRT